MRSRRPHHRLSGSYEIDNGFCSGLTIYTVYLYAGNSYPLSYTLRSGSPNPEISNVSYSRVGDGPSEVEGNLLANGRFNTQSDWILGPNSYYNIVENRIAAGSMYVPDGDILEQTFTAPADGLYELFYRCNGQGAAQVFLDGVYLDVDQFSAGTPCDFTPSNHRVTLEITAGTHTLGLYSNNSSPSFRYIHFDDIALIDLALSPNAVLTCDNDEKNCTANMPPHHQQGSIPLMAVGRHRPVLGSTYRSMAKTASHLIRFRSLG